MREGYGSCVYVEQTMKQREDACASIFFLYRKICAIALDTQLALANKCGPTKD